MDLVDRRSAGGPDGVAALAAEADRLRWLGGRAGAPEVVSFEQEGNKASLATTSTAGIPASDPAHRVDSVELATVFASALRAVHGLDPGDCPFDQRLAVRRREIERRAGAGLLTASQLSEPYRRHDPRRLLALWRDATPVDDEDLVVVHGDFTLDNVRLAARGVVEVVAWGRCGVADRYVDLAVAARSLADAVGPEPVTAFFDAYGLGQPSLAKIDFYALAAELLA